MELKKTNDLKKGTKVMLSSHCTAVINDNRKGNIRNMKVNASEIGFFDSIGDEYAHKIVSWFNEETETWERVELTPAQKKLMVTVRAMGM